MNRSLLIVVLTSGVCAVHYAPATMRAAQPATQFRWQSVKVGQVVPGGAVIGSVERSGEINYVCRGMKGNGLHAGKGVLQKCLIAYGENETETDGGSYDVLVGSSPRWDRFDERGTFLPIGYEHRGSQKFDTYGCLGQWIAENAPLGKILPFDQGGTCHVPAGGSAYKTNDRNQFVALTSVAPPLAEDTAEKAFLFGTEEGRTDRHINVSVWDGTCHTYDFGGQKAIRRIRLADTEPFPHGDYRCAGKVVWRYEFPPGNLLR